MGNTNEDMCAAASLRMAIRPGTAWDGFPLPKQWTRRGTVRAWFEARGEGAEVCTLQANVSKWGTLSDAWSPGWRIVDDLSAGGVSMSGSLREFAGLRVVHADDRHLVAVATWGERRQAVLFMV